MNTQQTFYVEEEFSGADGEIAGRLLSLQQDPSPALVARVRAIPTLPQQKRWQMPGWAWGLVAVTDLLTVLVASRLRSWKQTLVIVQPGTLVHWHRDLFRWM
jgi:hypothetical protein